MGCADHLGEVWRESCVRGSTPGHCKGFVAKRRCSSAAVAEGAASTGESGRRYSAEACKRTGAARKSSYKQDAVDTAEHDTAGRLRRAFVRKRPRGV